MGNFEVCLFLGYKNKGFSFRIYNNEYFSDHLDNLVDLMAFRIILYEKLGNFIESMFLFRIKNKDCLLKFRFYKVKIIFLHDNFLSITNHPLFTKFPSNHNLPQPLYSST